MSFYSTKSLLYFEASEPIGFTITIDDNIKLGSAEVVSDPIYQQRQRVDNYFDTFYSRISYLCVCEAEREALPIYGLLNCIA